MGVFAKKELHPGVMIPIIAYPQMGDNTQHEWYYGGYRMNGSPLLCPYKDVGSRGFAIAMMVNEASKARDMNCALSSYGHLVVIKTCGQGEELLTWYGKDYDRAKYDYRLEDSRGAYERKVDDFFDQNIANYTRFEDEYHNLRRALWETERDIYE